MLRHDVGLTEIGTVVFDEVHERRIDCDLSIAMCLYARDLIRPDLRLVGMSATLDTEKTSRLLGAQTIGATAPLFDVSISYEPALLVDVAKGAAKAVVNLLASTKGDGLVFLPGAKEIGATIRQLERLVDLSNEGIVIGSLSGTSTLVETDRALQSAPAGFRKVVLATSVVQANVTIPGVRSGVDSGLTRRSSLDAATGVSLLAQNGVPKRPQFNEADAADAKPPVTLFGSGQRQNSNGSIETDAAEILDTKHAEMVVARSMGYHASARAPVDRWPSPGVMGTRHAPPTARAS